MHRAACLVALALACRGGEDDPTSPRPTDRPGADIAAVPDSEPVVGPTAPDSVPTEDPADPAGAPALSSRPAEPPVLPAHPALHSWTGQGTHLGIGLWSAFYPLGWSAEGRFAWASERRVNDMSLEYGVTWWVVDPDGERGTVSWAEVDREEGLTLARAWSEREAELSALFRDQGIAAGGVELRPLPADTPHGRLEASWTTRPLPDHQQQATLTLTWPDGHAQVLADQRLPSLPGAPAAPSLIMALSGDHAVVVAPVVEREPVEALVDVHYAVYAVDLRAGRSGSRPAR